MYYIKYSFLDMCNTYISIPQCLEMSHKCVCILCACVCAFLLCKCTFKFIIFAWCPCKQTFKRNVHRFRSGKFTCFVVKYTCKKYNFIKFYQEIIQGKRIFIILLYPLLSIVTATPITWREKNVFECAMQYLVCVWR